MPASPAIFTISSLQATAPVIKTSRTASSNNNIFSIVWIISGRGHCGVDRLEYGLGERQLICLGPGKDYALDIHPRSEGFMIHFNRAFLEAGEPAVDLSYQDDLYSLFSTPAAMTVKEEMLEEMEGIARRMVTESENLLSRHHVRREEPMFNTHSARLVQKFLSMLG